jgi:PTS system mannose-specific IIA component
MKKIGGVVVSHGHLASELVSAAETVVGPVEHILAVSIGWHDDVDMAKD